MPRTQPDAQPPPEPTQPEPSPSPALAERFGAAGAAAAVAPGVVAGATLAQATEIAGAIISNTAKFLVRRQNDDLLFLVMALGVLRPELPRADAEKLAREQLAYEKKFRDGVVARMRRDLPKALQLANPDQRRLRVQEILEREKRYLAMRQEAMLDRAIAETEHRQVREMSPQGAFWKLSPYVKEHTLDCIAMGEKFWPWEVLKVVHPPTHHGCRCRLYTLGEATEQGWMTEDQIPDTKEAVARAAKIAKEFGLIKESLTAEAEQQLIEELLEEAQLEALRDENLVEAVRRYPKGFVKGGEFRPQRGYDPGLRVRRLIGHLLTPALARRRSRGEWRRLAGRSVFVPEARGFKRTFGGRTFTSPPGTSDVFVDGRPHGEAPRSPRTGRLAVGDPELARLVDEWYRADARRGQAALAGAPDLPKLEREADEAERRYHEARVKLGIGKPAPGLQVGDRVIDDQGFDGSITKIDGDRISVKLESGGTFRYRPEQLRQPGKPSPETAFRVAAYAADRNTKQEMPVAVGASGADTVDGLEAAGFRETSNGEGRNNLWMQFSHQSGARLRVTFSPKTGRVTGADWTPGQAVRPHDQPLQRPPVSYREWTQSLDDYVRRTASEHGTVPHLNGIHIDETGEIADDHSGSHEWTGEVMLGREVLDDIDRMAIERDHGQPITDPGDVWSSYRVGYHEAGHAVNPISMDEYKSYEGMGLEEVLTEEAGHSEAIRALQQQGQNDVIDWLAANPTDHRALGTYPGFRKRMDDLLNEAKIDPADREEVIRDLKFDTRPEDRYDRLADMLVASGAFEDHEQARKHARTHIGGGEHDLAGFVPIVPTPGEGPPLEFRTKRGVVKPGSRVLIRTRVMSGTGKDRGFKTELLPATVVDIGNKLNDPEIPFTASVSYDRGGGAYAVVPDEIARVLDDSPDLTIDGKPLKPGDGIRYDNQRDDGYRQATVQRILRIGDHWAVEARNENGQTIVLTPGRAGKPLERAVPDELQPETPAQPATPAPERATRALPGPDDVIPSAREIVARGLAQARTRLARAVADVEEQFEGRHAHIASRERLGFPPTSYDIGHLQGLELGRRALLNGATPDDLLKVALTYGPRRGGSEQNEGLQAGLRGAALALRDQAPDAAQFTRGSPGTKLSPDSGDPKMFYGDAADDPHGFAEKLKALGAQVPAQPKPSAEPEKLVPVDPQALYGGEILEHPETGERWKVVDAIGNKKKLRKARVQNLATKHEETWKPKRLAQMLFVSGGSWQPKEYKPAGPPQPKTTDDGQLTMTKPAGGMGGAMFAEDANGDPWVIKGYKGNVDRVANELVANRVYRALGVPVPEAGTRDVQGKPALAYRRVDGTPGSNSMRVEKPSKDIGKGFMADALLANWDVVGLDHDNLLWPTGKVEGEPVRLDQGGTFSFRALGSRKPFGPVPSEVWSMRSPKGQAFNTMDVSDDDLRAQAAHIAATLTPEAVGDLFADAPFVDPHMREEHEVALNARIDWMRRFSEGEVDVPKPLEGVEAHDMFGESQTDLVPLPEQALALEKFPSYEAEVQDSLRASRTPADPLTAMTDQEAQEVSGWGALAKEAVDERELEGHDVRVLRNKAGQPVAVVAVAPGREGYLKLTRLATKTQGKGGGTAALKAAAGIAGERGLGLEVEPSLQAQDFYRQAGMTKDETNRFVWSAEQTAQYRPIPKHVNFMVGELDTLLRKAKTREDAVGYLVVPKEAAADADPEKLVGASLGERGFLLMTTDPRFAWKQGKGGLIFRVMIPAGSNVLAPGKIADQDYPKAGPQLIGARNSRLRVRKAGVEKGVPVLDAILA